MRDATQATSLKIGLRPKAANEALRLNIVEMSLSTPPEKPEVNEKPIPTSESTAATSLTTVESSTGKDDAATKDEATATIVDDEEQQSADAMPADSGDADLPTGAKLAVIIIALLLSVFLFSLDQVSRWKQTKDLSTMYQD